MARKIWANKLKRFWSALESIPGQAATLVEWQAKLGPEFELAKPLLRANGTLAEVIPSFGLGTQSELLHVVRHSRENIVGISEEGDCISLTQQQTAIYELDREKLLSGICFALTLQRVQESNFTSSRDQAYTIIGTYELGGIRYPVYLVIPNEDGTFNATIGAIPGGREQPIVILTPTAHYIQRALRDRLDVRGSCILALADILALSIDGRWECIKPPIQILSAAHRFATGEPTRADGVYSQSEIVWAGVMYRCDVTKRQMALLKLGLSAAEIEVRELINPKSGILQKKRFLNTPQHRNAISQFLSRLNAALYRCQPSLGMTFSLRRNSDCICRSDPVPKLSDAVNDRSVTED